MNILQPEEEEDPFAPIKAPAVEGPSIAAPQILRGANDNAGGGGGAPAGVTVQIGQRPEMSRRTEQKGEQVNQAFVQASPEAAAEIGNIGIAHGEAEAARAEQAKHREPVAEINALGEEKQALSLQLTESEKRSARLRAEPKIRAAVAADEQATKEVEANRKFTDYWEDKGTAAKIFATLLVGLNEYARSGRGMGGPNMAWEIFKQAEAGDRQKKLDKFQASKDFAEIRKKGVDAARQALKDEENRLDNEGVARGKAYAQETKALAARVGKPGALAAAAEVDAKAKAEEAKTRLEQRQGYETKFTVEGEQTSSSRTVNTGGAGAATNGLKPVYSADGKTVLGGVGDEVTQRKMQDKVAAYQKVRDLTQRLSKANVEAPVGSKERTQIEADLDALATAQAILNNNEGKPSDSDIKNARDEVGSTFGMGTKAWAAKTFGKPGWDPRARWTIINDRAKEKLDADLGSHFGPNQIPDAAARAERAPPTAAAAPKEPEKREAPKRNGKRVETKEIGGKTFVRVGGKWKVQDN